VELNISSNVREIEKELGIFYRKQIPFATAKAINETLFDVRQQLVAGTVKHIDRPTPFTKRGFQVQKAKKSTLAGAVFVPPNRLDYMSPLVHGGTKENVNEPVNVKLNKYGNISKAQVKQWKSNPQRFFFGVPKGMSGENAAGVWERYAKGTRIRQVTKRNRRREVRRQYPFYEIAQKEAIRVFDYNLGVALRRAINTAR
jgi:hypothetical protein